MGDETGGWQVVGGFGGLRTQLASVPVAELRACLRIGHHDLSESDGFGASRITLLRRGCQVLTGKLWNDECIDGDGYTGKFDESVNKGTGMFHSLPCSAGSPSHTPGPLSLRVRTWHLPTQRKRLPGRPLAHPTPATRVPGQPRPV